MFISILQQTPDWVWGLLAALTSIGLKQTLPRRRSLRASISLPLVMVFLSLYGVASAFPSQPLALIAWAGGGAVTLLLAQTLRVWGEIRWLPQERSVLMPGSWLPLVLLLGLFVVKFAVAVALSMTPGLAVDAGFAGFTGLVYGAFSGVFLARTLAVWRVVRSSSLPSRSTSA
jgi:hypothetical protein